MTAQVVRLLEQNDPTDNGWYDASVVPWKRLPDPPDGWTRLVVEGSILDMPPLSATPADVELAEMILEALKDQPTGGADLVFDIVGGDGPLPFTLETFAPHPDRAVAARTLFAASGSILVDSDGHLVSGGHHRAAADGVTFAEAAVRYGDDRGDGDAGYVFDSGVVGHPTPVSAAALLIVDHLASLWGVPADERQATNDEADDYVCARIREVLEASRGEN